MIDPALAASMSEAALQRHVNGLLDFYGWRHFHAPDNKPRAAGKGRAGRQHITPGFPDTIATRDLEGVGPELIIAELKRESGSYGPGQAAWLAAFEALSTAVASAVRRAEDGGHGPTVLGEPAIGVYTWRPSDLEEIERVLAGPRGVGVMVTADDFRARAW